MTLAPCDIAHDKDELDSPLGTIEVDPFKGREESGLVIRVAFYVGVCKHHEREGPEFAGSVSKVDKAVAIVVDPIRAALPRSGVNERVAIVTVLLRVGAQRGGRVPKAVPVPVGAGGERGLLLAAPQKATGEQDRHCHAQNGDNAQGLHGFLLCGEE